MPRPDRDEREQQIEAAAYRLLEGRGFAATGMRMIAQEAHASIETLYRWYGDKTGMFAALIARNAAEVGDVLDGMLDQDARATAVLARAGPALLTMLLGERAVALNRAAAADATATLGPILAREGRDAMAPRIADIMARALAAEEFGPRRDEPSPQPADLAELWLTLLIGDLQIRRVTGAIGPLSPDEIARRSDAALACLGRLYPARPAARDGG